MRLFLFCIFYLWAQNALAQPVEDFAQLPKLRDVQLAPDGSGFSARVEKDGRYQASVYKFVDGQIQATFAAREDDELWVRELHWANPDRLIVSLGFAARRYQADTIESRLYGLDAHGGDLEPLFNIKKNETPVQIEDDIISWLPNDPNNILVQYRADATRRESSVFQVAVNDRKIHRTAQRAQNDVLSWQADHFGEIRVGRGFKNNTETQRHLQIRARGTKEWIDFSERVGDDKPTFNILGFGNKDEIVLVESGHEFDPPALYEFNILTSEFGKLLYKNDNVEISSIRLHPRTGELQGITYVEDEAITTWLDPAISAEIKRLAGYFENSGLTFRSESRDGSFAVYYVSAPQSPGQYYIFNRATSNLIKLPPQNEKLENASLAAAVTANYPARDGLKIPAYVTLPTGITTLSELQKAPFVILPHGGPKARDFLRYNYWTKFLASRGYGVLQMNFRGSAGYGDAFQLAGEREWGQAMQDDITDGVAWLVEAGYADPDRIAIMGGSYGGYAALMGGAKTPELYQCVVSFAGVSDLPELIRTARKYIGGRAGTRHIGLLWKDRVALRENSPVRLAENFTAPVLLIHGEDDRVVDINQSRRMRSALKREGKAVTFFELENGDHHLSLYPNRLRFLKEVENFLSECL